jgi:hypothetical protein
MHIDNLITEAQLDAELERVTNYVARLMTTDEAEAFEDELRENEAFFDRVAPMLKVWYSRAPGYTMAQTRERIRVRALDTKATPTPSAARSTAVSIEEPTSPAARPHDPKVIPITEGVLRRDQRRRFRTHIVAALASAAGIVTIAFGVLSTPAVQQLESVAALAPRLDPLPKATMIAVGRPRPAQPTIKSPTIAIAQNPVVAAVAENTLAIDSLPSVGRGAEPRIEGEIEVKSNVQVAVQWPPADGWGKRFGDVAHAVGDRVGAFWGKLRHPRTHRPGPGATPSGL